MKKDQKNLKINNSMTLSLNTIKANKKASKKRKRIGRGNASGKGTYAGRGLKGQKARSGVSNLKRLGMKQVLLRTPKKRGFKSLKPKAQVVNLADLERFFKNGEVVTPKTLQAKGLIDTLDKEVKILAKGKLSVKKLEFHGVKFSATAKESLIKLQSVIK